MQLYTRTDEEPRSGMLATIRSSIVGRVLTAFLVLAIILLVLWQGFVFLRDSIPETTAAKGMVSFVAIIWGVGGVAMLFVVSNWLIEQLSVKWVKRLQPFLFVGPAVAMLAWYVALPMVRTFWISLFGSNGPPEDLLPLKSFFISPTEYIGVISEAYRNTGMVHFNREIS